MASHTTSLSQLEAQARTLCVGSRLNGTGYLHPQERKALAELALTPAVPFSAGCPLEDPWKGGVGLGGVPVISVSLAKLAGS